MIMQAKPVSGRGQKPASTYQLQVLLNGTQPPIWRRLQVPGTANLGWLRAVLQVAMRIHFQLLTWKGLERCHAREGSPADPMARGPTAEVKPAPAIESATVARLGKKHLVQFRAEPCRIGLCMVAMVSTIPRCTGCSFSKVFSTCCRPAWRIHCLRLCGGCS